MGPPTPGLQVYQKFFLCFSPKMTAKLCSSSPPLLGSSATPRPGTSPHWQHVPIQTLWCQAGVPSTPPRPLVRTLIRGFMACEEPGCEGSWLIPASRVHPFSLCHPWEIDGPWCRKVEDCCIGFLNRPISLQTVPCLNSIQSNPFDGASYFCP